MANDDNIVLLSLGSNMPMPLAESKISQAIKSIAKWARIEAMSEVYASTGGYANMVAVVSTTMRCDAVIILTKTIEAEMGRTPAMKIAGLVPIDIDVVKYGTLTLRPAELAAEYAQPGLAQVRAQLPDLKI